MNALIVDDEDYVLDYLEENIKWPELGVERLFRANSVDEALEVLSAHPVAVTISDIRMPERSGLELLTEIRSRNLNIKVILLTGYSEFEYAKQAIREGTADYLLKPVTDQEVEEALQRVIGMIRKENKEQADLQAAENMLHYGVTRIRAHFLLDILLGKRFPADELNLRLASLRLPCASDSEYALALLRVETDPADSAAEDLDLFHFAAINMAEEIYKELGVVNPVLWTCTDAHNYLVMLLPVSPFGGLHTIEEGMKQLHHAFKTYVRRTVSILLTQPLVLNAKPDQVYLGALHDFGRLIGTKHDMLLSLDQQPVSRQKLKPLTRLYETPALMQLMDTGRWEEAEQRLNSILAELNEPDYRTQEHAAEVIYHLYNCFTYLAHKQGDSLTNLLGNTASAQLLHLHSTAHIRGWAEQLMEPFKRSLPDNSGNQNRIVRQIQEYIALNLKSDLSLTVIGELVYLHPVYLSRLYKKATGESLTTYITRVRMEQAASLLTSSNMKVTDISGEVGYHKPQYFISLFKDHFGCTPQIYRNK